MKGYCFLDVETTGVNPFEDKIIEIAVILADENLKIIQSYESRLYTPLEYHNNNGAQNIHKISPEELLTAPPRKQVMEHVISMIDKTNLIVNYNVYFDWFFINAEIQSLQLKRFLAAPSLAVDKRVHLIDISTLSYPLAEIGSIRILSFEAICKYFGIVNKKQHSAMSDVLAAIQAFRILKDQMCGSLL